MTLEYFANDRFMVLKVIQSNQVVIRENEYCTLSQQEIADLVCFSKLKVNRIINDLIKEGFIILHNNKRGKYALTHSGKEMVNVFLQRNERTQSD